MNVTLNSLTAAQEAEEPIISLKKSEAEHFLYDLEKAQMLRQQSAEQLLAMAEAIARAESEGEQFSGRLGIERDVADLELASKNLRQGVFRLLVLGDMKRGKSTFLNALIGERVLPADVNPCTAVLTVLRFGQQKSVTVHFNDGKSPQMLDFDSFKRDYTIPPAEAKKLEEEGKQAFPDVEYAVVEYPLDILEKGVEIIDSPGLNDTEARNNLTLSYIQSCHAILFVLSATQQLTLGERRYLENYLKDRGLTVFFLINQWDRIRESLVIPDDRQELQEAEERVRQVFESNLWEYCQVEGQDRYDERVFELSSLDALRRRLQQPSASLEGTGFSEFMKALDNFLTKERATAELRQARTLARQAYANVHEAIDRRLPLLGQSVNELKEKIKSIQPEFDSLGQIREQFRDEIRMTKDRSSAAIADSCYAYLMNLDATFEADFQPYQPDLKVFEFLRQKKRQEFTEALQQAFEKYLNDKISAWSREAEAQMNQAFSELAASAAQYGTSYSEVTGKITETLVGQPKLEANPTPAQPPGWSQWAAGATAFLMGDYVGAAMAGTGAFNWKRVATNLAGLIAINAALIVGFDIVLGPIGLLLSSTVLGGLQLNHARKALVENTKKEMVKVLPDLAQKQAWAVHQAVEEIFDNYEQEVVERINEDIQGRKAELENLLNQKETQEIDRDAEAKRLKGLDTNLFTLWNRLEAVDDSTVAQA